MNRLGPLTFSVLAGLGTAGYLVAMWALFR